MPLNDDERYEYYMSLAEHDPEKAGHEFLQFLESLKRSKKTLAVIQQLERILSGDVSAWQRHSKNLTDAVQFLISNTLLRGQGMGVLNVGPRESVVSSVANMISEDIDFMPMTPLQRRMKTIAESHGFSVYMFQ